MAIDDTTVLQQAAKFLNAGEGALDAIRVHQFQLNGDKHDDDAVAVLHEDFRKDFDAATHILSNQYGTPSRSGTNDDEAIPLTGIEAFNIWKTDKADLFLAICHEDRDAPILLMLGCTG